MFSPQLLDKVASNMPMMGKALVLGPYAKSLVSALCNGGNGEIWLNAFSLIMFNGAPVSPSIFTGVPLIFTRKIGFWLSCMVLTEKMYLSSSSPASCLCWSVLSTWSTL